MKIAVVTPKNREGTTGGAENLYAGLIAALRNAGHETTQIEIITDESSFEGILEAYCRCFYLDLHSFDLVISTKAPTYMVRHRNHISYLLHTIRVFYDMFDSEFDPRDKEKLKQKKLIQSFDKFGLDPVRVKRHGVIGEVVAERMKRADPFWENINFEVIHPAPLYSEFPEPCTGEFIFLPGRLHRWKRIDLVIRAMCQVKKGTKLLIAGIGEDDSRLRNLVANLSLEDRVEFLGKITSKQLLDLYSRSIVIPFVPLNEDFGYVAVEAFRTKKPVITCRDSGEPARIVKDEVNGFVVEPQPEKIAEKINYCIEHPTEASLLGEAGYRSVQEITWQNVVRCLLDSVEIVPLLQSPEPVRVMVADMQPIEPAIGGGRLRLKGLYSSLGKNIQVTYIGTYDWRGEKYREVSHSGSFKEIDIPLSEEHFRLNEFMNNLVPGKVIIDSVFPFLVSASPDFVAKTLDEAKKSEVIVFSHPWLYPAIKTGCDLRGKILIYDSQNCEAALKETLLGNLPFARCISHMVKFFEQELIEAADLVLACSEADKEQFVKLYQVNPDKIEVFPNGVNCSDLQPTDKSLRKQLREKMKITQSVAVFVGSEYQPNIEAGKYIIEVLAARCPDILFLIVGGAGNTLEDKKRANVRIYGIVSDDEKKSLLAVSDIAINPVITGSGTNIKMFDFMAAGLPTITTPAGARGIIDNESFIVADRPEFPEAIRHILADSGAYAIISQNARTLVEEEYDWKGISEKLGRRISELYASRHTP
jgi:glycosyltransferase involved in cell wall biosynthesis